MDILLVNFQDLIMIGKKFLSLASPNIRSPRSERVKYRVGQVIQHKLYRYRAVIIGWDEIASAPDEWLDEHHQGHPVSRNK
jgi:heat shock protein HspQ